MTKANHQILERSRMRTRMNSITSRLAKSFSEETDEVRPSNLRAASICSFKLLLIVATYMLHPV